MVSTKGFNTPQQTALARWEHTPKANARILEITVRGDRAEVVLEVGPGYREWVYCLREGGGWHEVSSGNGPTVGWEDPNTIQWATR
jgi:hypothetical protein